MTEPLTDSQSGADKQSGKNTDRPKALTAYMAVTAVYWSFMLTDGALRMLVLLHFHTLGFSPFQLAYLFLLYELAGMLTNLCAGWLAARYGLTSTLYAGLVIQILALLALSQLDSGWSIVTSVVFVMAVQGASGVAKDLTKMSSKSAVKLLAPSGKNDLFLWVAVLTGSKNTVKGLGFLLGAALLATVGFYTAVVAMALVLAVILGVVVMTMPAGLPSGIKGVKFSSVFSTAAQVNWLSLARVFLFGARDVWFVVGVPVYFYSVISDGSDSANRIAFFMIGTFMAAWIIVYGVVQMATPRLLNSAGKPLDQLVASARSWVLLLFFILAGLASAVMLISAQDTWLTLTIVAGLLLFAVVFAVNSALHSYLILAFSESQRVTMDVGFYYMANAVGRLLGTLLSGLSYQAGGLALCLSTAALLVLISWVSVHKLHRINQNGQEISVG